MVNKSIAQNTDSTMGPFEILCIIATIFLSIYYHSIYSHNFWKIRGVQGPKPLPLFGNVKDLLFGRFCIGEFAKNIYDAFPNERLVGIFARNTPIVVIRKPELIKDILVKDFNTFSDRGIPIHEKVDVLSPHLFSLEPKRWRPLRRNLSPVFTSGKLKEMFYLLLESSENMGKYLEKIVPENKPIECRDLTSKFTINVIGSCAFGIDVNTLCNEENDFLRLGKRIFDPSFLKLVLIKMRDSLPWLYDLLGPFLEDSELSNFFVNLIKDTMQYRKENNIVRHDFVDLLRHFKENPDRLGDIELTDTFVAAQAFVFFVAGYETSSTTMSNALYELALNTSIQDKLRQEIQKELEETGGKLIYDRIKDMKYLHKVFQETLRKYPPISILTRKSTEKYTFPDTDVTIPKGTVVWIPIYGIQRDPKYYPDPETFDPERFEDEEVKSRNPMLFLSFGDGPRNCIGARFGVYQTKVGLIQILQNYRVDVCEKTPIPYVNHSSSFLLKPVGGIYLKFSKVS